MTIAPGDRVPHASLLVIGAEGSRELSTDSLFGGRTVALFGAPGAFTPTCSGTHLPSIIEHAPALRAAGVDDVICMAVNDRFVMEAWGREQGVDGRVSLLADGSAEFTRLLGLEFDLAARRLGVRCQRFALLARDRVVEYLAVDRPGDFSLSRVERMLQAIA